MVVPRVFLCYINFVSLALFSLLFYKNKVETIETNKKKTHEKLKKNNEIGTDGHGKEMQTLEPLASPSDSQSCLAFGMPLHPDGRTSTPKARQPWFAEGFARGSRD